MSKQIKQPAAYSTDKPFKAGKYADDNLSYYEIAKKDPSYAAFWASKADASNPKIPLTFQAAIDRVAEERQTMRSARETIVSADSNPQNPVPQQTDWRVPDYPHPPTSIYSICRCEKYQEQGKTFLDIAANDRAYVDWFLSDENRAQSRSGVLFREAIDHIDEERAPRATELQFLEFYILYPPAYWREEAEPLFYALSEPNASRLLEVLRDCVRCEWTNMTEIPPSDGFVRGWELLERRVKGRPSGEKHFEVVENEETDYGEE